MATFSPETTQAAETLLSGTSLKGTPEQRSLAMQAAKELNIRDVILGPQAPSTFNVEIPDKLPTGALSSSATPSNVIQSTPLPQQQLPSPQDFVSSLFNTVESDPNNLSAITSQFFTSPITALEQEAQDLRTQFGEGVQDIRGLQARRGSQADRFQQLRDESRFGGQSVNQLEANLRRINSDIAALEGEFGIFQADLENTGGITTGGFEARLNPARRMFVAEQGALAAAQQAAIGNLDLAQQNIDTVLGFEFADEQQQVDDLFNELALVSTEIKNLEPVLKAEAENKKTLFEKVLQERQNTLDERKAVRSSVMSIATQASLNGAPRQVVESILDSATDQQALLAAGEFYRDPEDVLKEQLLRLQIQGESQNQQLTRLQIDEAILAQQQRDEMRDAGVLSSEQYETVDKIDKEFRSEPVVKEYNEMVAKSGAVTEILNNGVNGVQDMLLVYEFMKSVDPTSVVRESEFDNAAKTGNIFSGAYTKFNKGYFGEGGFLPENVKASFVNSLAASMETKTAQYLNVKSEFAKKVDRRLQIENGVDLLTQYDLAVPNPEDIREGEGQQFSQENIEFGITPASSTEVTSIWDNL